MRGGPNSADAYGLPFNQQMSFPCELTLRTTPDGVRLFCWPVKEIDSLVTKTHNLRDVTLVPGENLLSGLDTFDLVDASIDFDPGTAKEVVFDFPGVTLTYDVAKRILVHTGLSKKGQPQDVTTLDFLAPRDGSVRLRFLIDRLSLEVYAFEGENFQAHYFSPKHGDSHQSIHSVGGQAKVKELTIRELKSAWK
jgi:sucrose-6-phosphate hydrolase SacC (GH32 family)